MRTNINNKGFTLVELLIVTAIVGILAAVAIPTYLHFVDRAKLISSVSAVKVVQIELQAYMTDNGSYPSSVNFTNFTDQNGTPILAGSAGWNDMSKRVLSWDSYDAPDPINDYTLVAKGKDSDQTIITLTPLDIIY